MTIRIGSLAVILMAAGCAATPEEYASQVIAAYGPYCDKLGYQSNTDAWRMCIQLEDTRAAASAAAFNARTGRP